MAFVLGGCATWFVGDDPVARREVARGWFAEARVALETGEVDEARELLIDAVELSPEYAEARNALGILLLLEGKVKEAILQFKWATANEPRNPYYHYNLALAYMAAGSVGFATPALNRTLELAPDFEPAKRTLLDAYLILGRWDQAKKLLQRYREAIRKDPWLLYQSGLLAFANEETERAEKLLKAAARALPEQAEPLAALAVLYDTLGRVPLADRTYRAALKREGGKSYLYLAYADFLIATGRYHLAEKQLKSVLRRRSLRRKLTRNEIAQAWYDLANVRYQQGAYRTAALYQRRAAKMLAALKGRKLKPDAIAHFGLGLVELERENVDKAIAEFKRALAADERFVLAWVRYADALLLKAKLSPVAQRRGLLRKARKAAQRATDLAPRAAIGYYTEGRVMIDLADLEQGAFRTGMLREALFILQKARNAENPPEDVPIYQARLLEELGAYAQAASAITQARVPSDRRFTVAFLEASQLIRAKRFKAARRALTRAYALDATHPDLGPAMSYVLYQLGDVETAIAALGWRPGQGPLPGVVPELLPPELRPGPEGSRRRTDSARERRRQR